MSFPSFTTPAPIPVPSVIINEKSPPLAAPSLYSAHAAAFASFSTKTFLSESSEKSSELYPSGKFGVEEHTRVFSRFTAPAVAIATASISFSNSFESAFSCSKIASDVDGVGIFRISLKNSPFSPIIAYTSFVPPISIPRAFFTAHLLM